MILELENALELDKDVQPACIPFNANFDDTSFTEEQCFTSGWGATYSGGEYYQLLLDTTALDSVDAVGAAAPTDFEKI